MKLMDLMKVRDIPFSLEHHKIASPTAIYPVDYKKAGLIIDDVRTFYSQPAYTHNSNAGNAPHYGTLVTR